MEKIAVEFTKEEAQVVIDLFHIATQARGLEVAEAAVVLRNKIASEFKKLEKEAGADGDNSLNGLGAPASPAN